MKEHAKGETGNYQKMVAFIKDAAELDRFDYDIAAEPLVPIVDRILKARELLREIGELR